MSKHIFHPTGPIIVRVNAYRPTSDIDGACLGLRCSDGDEINLHMMSPDDIMDLGRRIETAGAELANRMAFDAAHPEGPPIDHPEGCACELCTLVAAEVKRFEGVPY